LQVDGLIVSASRIYDNGAEELKTHVDRQRHFHEKNMEHYKSAREAYLRKIEETVDFLKKEGLSGTARVAADSVMARVEDAKKIPGYLNETSKVGPRLPEQHTCGHNVLLTRAEWRAGAAAQGLIGDRRALAQAVLDRVSTAWDKLQDIPAGACCFRGL